MIKNLRYTYKQLTDNKALLILLVVSVFLGMTSFLLYTILPALMISILERGSGVSASVMQVLFWCGLTWLLGAVKRLVEVYVTHELNMGRLSQGLHYYEHTMRLPYHYFDSAQGKSEMYAGLRSYMDDYHLGFTHLIMDAKDLVESLLGIVVSFVVLVNINGRLAVALVVLSLWMIPFGTAHKNFVRSHRQFWHPLDVYRKEIYDKMITTQAAKDMRMYHAEPWLDAIVTENISERMEWMNQENRSLLKQKVAEKLLMAAKYAVICYFIYVSMGTTELALLILPLSLSLAFSHWLDQAVEGLNFLKLNNELVNETRLVLDRKPSTTEAHVVQGHRWGIKLTDVSFARHAGGKKILRHISMDILPGEKISIVGHNGAGKTTLIKLILGLLEPTEGELYCYPREDKGRQFSPQSSFFAASFQDSELFAFSVAENVSGVSEDMTDRARVKECLQKVGLLALVEAHPKGIDAPVSKMLSEEGIGLSGGQKQRLLLARCLYKDAPIVILDEPTASLDALAEAKVYALCRELLAEKTVIFISHRLSSTLFSDRIYLLDGGEIKEDGSHDALMKAEGSYAALFHAQADQYQYEKTDSVKVERKGAL